MNYLIPGSHPALSAAELAAVLGPEKLSWSAATGVFLFDDDIADSGDLIRRVGGVVKIGQVVCDLPLSASVEETADTLTGLLPPGTGRVDFGLSLYGLPPAKQKPLAMTMKRLWRERGRAVRWVVSRSSELSSAAIGENDLIRSGAEFALIRQGKKIFAGLTTAIQDYRGLSDRDYGRPGRDDRSGMLPPKLAQIMINLARPDKKERLFDPFCGSGTILTEARLLGFDRLVGADISAKAINDTGANLDWIAERKSLPAAAIDLSVAVADRPPRDLGPGSIGAIVTEPYLGPARGRFNAKTKKELEALYSAALASWVPLLRPGGRVVMVWPVGTDGRRPGPGSVWLEPAIGSFVQADPLPSAWLPELRKYLSPSGRLLYGRPGQRVWREIVILEKE